VALLIHFSGFELPVSSKINFANTRVRKCICERRRQGRREEDRN